MCPRLLPFSTSGVLLLLLLIDLTGSTWHKTDNLKKRLRIEQGSRLYLKGTSNVNKFTCDCADQYPEQILEAKSAGGYVQFQKGSLHLKTKKFDCHNRKIDADMQKALDADHFPTIKVALVDALQDIKCLHGGCKDWFDVKANVLITIKETTNKEFLHAKVKIIAPDRLLVRGEKALQMSTFGVNPPEALFGMIKVDDWITFHFDLILTVEAVNHD
ncbi:MAG: YceI family protein [Saprospiraceae bacterium]|nr:YceI family protein [Saprospiraceae bacterium]